jgi:hypothetical protein
VVVNNKLTEIGDVLLFGTRILITGITSFSSFSDVVTGVTGTRTFIKKFRYSFNGVTYSVFSTLNTTNLGLIVFGTNQQIYLEFWYERSGADATGELEFDSLTINGNVVNYDREYPIGIKSIFRNIMFSSPEVMDLAINLTKKLYNSGILPEYIERGEEDGENDPLKDVDLIAFLKAVSHFFAMFVIYFKEFENIYFKREFIVEFIKQRGLFISEDEDITDYQYLTSNFFDEIRQRGTRQIVQEKNYVYPDATTKEVDGELLRLIAYVNTDEFLFNFVPSHLFGLNVDNASPLYCGMTQHNAQINKAPEDTDDCITPSKYFSNTAVASITDGPKKVFTLGTTGELSFKAKVDENLSYETTFFVRMMSSSNKLNVLVEYYNASGVVYSTIMNLDNTATTNKSMISNLSVNNSGKYLFVRCILFNKNRTNANAVVNNPIGIGQHKKLFAGVKSVKFTFLSDAANVSSPRLWNIKMKPLETPFETGFVQGSNFIEMWMKNNNFGAFNQKEIEEVVRYYLIPYNSTFKTIQL